MFYIVITKKNNEMCAITFLKACTLSHISSVRVTFNIQNCFYSEMLKKKKISWVRNLKKLYLEIFEYHIEKKIRVDYFRSKKAKKCFVEKKMLTVNLPWNDQYIYIIYISITDGWFQLIDAYGSLGLIDQPRQLGEEKYPSPHRRGDPVRLGRTTRDVSPDPISSDPPHFIVPYAHRALLFITSVANDLMNIQIRSDWSIREYFDTK